MKVFYAVFFLFGLSAFAATNDISLTVIAGAETHAMIDACDCPKDPGGGLAKRSTVIKTVGKREQILLLDAGGFSGGGMYDSYTEGRAADSLRTIATLRGMGVISYDAVAIGDDDLQYGGRWLIDQAAGAGVPLVSANCFTENGKLLAAPYILVKKGQFTFAVTGLTSTEKLFSVDRKISVREPAGSLRKVWKEMVGKSDFQVILSHLGQEHSVALRDSFPECDIIVNGHRKADLNAVNMNGAVPVMQFGFQGKSLSYADLRIKGNKIKLVKSGWLDIGPEIQEDGTLSAVVNSEPVKSRPVFDLYIMSQCPYGLEAVAGFLEFVKAFPEVDWSIRFIGTVETNGELSSLHGTEETNDEMVWLAVNDLYAEKWIQFLEQRSSVYGTTGTILKGLGVDMGKVEDWVSTRGKEELTSQYIRSTRLNINSSPSLFVNNSPYEGQISKMRLGKIQCSADPSSSIFCDSLPECFEDTDCRAKGKIGRCNSGKCEFRDAVPFVFTALVADSTIQNPENRIIETTRELFAGASVNIVKYNSEVGKELVKTHNPSAFPFYLFSSEVKQAFNFNTVEGGLTESKGVLTFKESVARKNYFHKRKLEKGSVVLFIDPFFKELPAVVNSFLVNSSKFKKFKVVPVFYNEPSKSFWGTEERFRQEEGKRWLLLSRRGKLTDYLSSYTKDPGSSYWFRICKGIGVNPDSLAEAARADTSLLSQQWSLMQELSIREPVVLLLDNRELVIIGNEQELKQVFQSGQIANNIKKTKK